MGAGGGCAVSSLPSAHPILHPSLHQLQWQPPQSPFTPSDGRLWAPSKGPWPYPEGNGDQRRASVLLTGHWGKAVKFLETLERMSPLWKRNQLLHSLSFSSWSTISPSPLCPCLPQEQLLQHEPLSLRVCYRPAGRRQALGLPPQAKVEGKQAESAEGLLSASLGAMVRAAAGL